MFHLSKEITQDDLFARASVSEEAIRTLLPEQLIPEKMFLVFEAFIDNFGVTPAQIGSSSETFPQNRVTRFVMEIINSTRKQLEGVHQRLLADFKKSKEKNTASPQQEETLHEFALMSSNALSLFDTLQFDVWYKEGFSGNLENIIPKKEEQYFFQASPSEKRGNTLKITNLNQIYIEISPVDARREE